MTFKKHLQVYLNYASRVNADTSMKKSEAQLLTDAPAEAGLQAMAPPEKAAQEDDQATSLEAAGEIRSQSPRKRRRKEPPAALVEADIDWDAKVNEHSSPTEIAHKSTSLKALDSAAGGIAEGRQFEAQFLTGGAAQGKSSTEECRSEGLTSKQGAASKTHQRELLSAGKAALSSAKPAVDPWETGKSSRREIATQDSKGHTSSSKCQDEALQESWSLSAAALEEYSPSRHGGESPPRIQPGLLEDSSYQVASTST